MTATRTIPLFFAVDDRYAPYLAVTLTSIIQNSNSQQQYEAIILHDHLAPEHQDRLAKLATDNVHVRFVQMGDAFAQRMANDHSELRCDYHTLTIFFRLFIADMFPEYDKGIYLDADVVVTTDIAQMFGLDLHGNYLGGCMDTYLADSPVTIAYVEDAVGVPMQSYINSGVLLMDLAALRQCNLGDRFLALLQQYDFDTIAPDQDYINALVHDHILRLDQTWNTMPTLPTMNQALTRPNVIHFNLFAKPWHYDHVMYSDFFWQYVPDSGYADEIALAKRNYSQDDVATDDANAEELVTKATALVADAGNFKHANERGVQVRI